MQAGKEWHRLVVHWKTVLYSEGQFKEETK
jgi:hypothetical protein